MHKNNYYLNFVVAVAYFASGQAGLLLAIPPSNAAAVWPAAGVALAVILIFGNRVLLGIFLGGMLVQTTSFLDISSTEKIISSFMIGTVISGIALLQAWVGARLVRNIIQRDCALLQEKSILCFCLLGGPVSCLISSTLSISTLWTVGILTAADIPLAWGTWWVGDSIGVLVFCPIVFCLFGKPRELWTQRITSVFLPLCFLTLAAFFGFKFSYKQEMQHVENAFEKNASQLADEIKRTFNKHMETNIELKEFFDSSNFITPQEFASFTSPKLSRHPDLQALEWIPKISHEEREQFENHLGYPISIPDQNGNMLPAPKKAFYFPIHYLEPYEGNEKALGYDISNNPLALEAALLSCDTGTISVTNAIKLVQGAKGTTGIVFYSPIYKKGFLKKDCEYLSGFIASVLPLENEMQYILNKFSDLKLSVSLSNDTRTIYQNIKSAAHTIPSQFKFERRYSFPVAQQKWEITFTPSIGFISVYSSWAIWLIIVGGLFFVAITGIGLLMLTGRTLRTEEEIILRTKELHEEVKERRLGENILSLEKKYLEMIAENFTLSEILESVSYGVEEIIPETLCSFLLLDSTGRHLNHGAGPSLPREYIEAIDGVEIGPKVGSCGTAAYFNKQVVVKDIENDPLWEDYKDLALKHGLKACWSTPVTTEGDKVLGTFALYFSEIKEPNTNQVDLINRFANIAAIAILRRQTEKMLTYQVSHDALTGLINRHEFERRAERLLSTLKHDKDEHAMCFMDLDQFKVVNDTCGHIAGDELLRQLGQKLQDVVRQRDTLARLGGDEFAVLMEHCSLKHAQRVAKSLQDVVQDFQFAWEDRSFKIGVSIGLVAINDQITSISELLKQADSACYMAKDLGRNRIHTYHPEDQNIAQRHGEMQWVTRLYNALEENRFRLFAQTIVPLDNTKEAHYELLLRMKDDKGKYIPPGAFLPAAERYNLMVKLDCWVIENAFSSIARNSDFLDKISFFSINLSGQSLTDPEFLDFVITQLDEKHINGDKVCFEITETAAISNVSSAIKFISTLKGLGCHFALDDFGSGLSSFGYLKNLPVDYLKIDGMFVKDIVDDPIDHAMVKSINEIGQVMGMKTIAEFVENDEIKGMLREIGVNYAQGFGIGKPISLRYLLQEKIETPHPVNF